MCLIKKNIYVVLLLFSFSFKSLMAQDINSNQEINTNDDIFYNRHAFSINVMPTIMAPLTALIIGGIGSAFGQMGSIFNPEADNIIDMGNVFGLGLGLSYEYAFTRSITVGLDTRVMHMNVDIFSMTMFDWNISFKMFVNGKRPEGFFIEPKIGGLYVHSDVGNEAISYYSTLITAEIGWRFLLFKKSGKDWKVKYAIDFSLFEIGYQNISYAFGQKIDNSGLGSPIIVNGDEDTVKRHNIFGAFIPTLAFTILF